MKKIDLLVAENLYGTVLQFSKSLSGALEKEGIQTRLFWVGEGNFFHAYYEILEDPPDLTCSFSDITLGGRPLGDLWKTPHLTLLLDPPIYFLHQLTTLNGWVSCVDQKDCAFIHSLGFTRSFFLPHAACSKHWTSVKKERPFEAVFFGTCIDYQSLEVKWAAKERELLLTAAAAVLSPEGPSVAQALMELGVQSFDLPRLHDALDLYIRGKERVALVRAYPEKLHIWGEGPWEKYCPDATLHPSVDFEETLEIMKKSQRVLNSSPRFKAGGHERIFYALMCGAAVLTGMNPYLSAHLPEAAFYRYGEWELPSLHHWEEYAESGQQRVLNFHTWDHRASTLLSSLNF